MFAIAKWAWIVSILFFCYCKKTNDNTDKLEMTYNGQLYTLSGYQFDFFAEGMLKIQDAPSFPFKLLIIQKHSSNGNYCGLILSEYCCQYVYDLFNYQTLACEPFVNDDTGKPVDSTKVFKYTSGTVTHSWSDCHEKSGIDLITGAPVVSSYCHLNGQFSMEAINGAGDKISVSGTFERFNFLR